MIELTGCYLPNLLYHSQKLFTTFSSPNLGQLLHFGGRFVMAAVGDAVVGTTEKIWK